MQMIRGYFPFGSYLSILDVDHYINAGRRIMSSKEIDNLNETIAQALQQMKAELGDKFSLKKVNLAELSRRTGISRKRLRNAKKHGFRIPVHGNTGRKKNNTVLTGYTAIIDILLRKGVTNSNVILERLQEILFIGMIHAFQRLGVPATVLTDNMNRYMRSSSIVSLCFLQVLPGLSTGL